MEMTRILILGLSIAFLAALSWVLLQGLLPSRYERRLRDLLEVRGTDARRPPSALELLLPWLEPLAQFARPPGEWERWPLRVRFYNAGLRSRHATTLYLLARILLALLLPAQVYLLDWALATPLIGPVLFLVMLAVGAFGFELPSMMLSRRIAWRHAAIRRAIPDALDLLRLCVESGLPLGGAIERTGRELAMRHPELFDEFQLLSLELRSGTTMAEALRHLAVRVGLAEVDMLVAVLVQAERIGFSLPEALRVCAQRLRVLGRTRPQTLGPSDRPLESRAPGGARARRVEAPSAAVWSAASFVLAVLAVTLSLFALIDGRRELQETRLELARLEQRFEALRAPPDPHSEQREAPRDAASGARLP